MTDIEKYMADNGIVQITAMPETHHSDPFGDSFKTPASYSVVIGNNRYFGFTIAEAVSKKLPTEGN